MTLVEIIKQLEIIHENINLDSDIKLMIEERVEGSLNLLTEAAELSKHSDTII